MGETDDIMQAILHESDTEARRKAFIRELAQAVAREIPRECPLGLTAEELRDQRALASCFRHSRVAAARLLWMLLVASLVGGLHMFLEKVGIGWLLK